MSESDCRQIAEWITSYVEGGLEGRTRLHVERHTENCPPCRGRLVQEQGARAVLRHRAETLKDLPLPPGLESRCQAIAGDQQSHRRASSWRMVAPGALAAVVLMVVAIGALSFLTGRSSTLMAAQLTADHMKCFAVFKPREVTGGDARSAERQLASYGWQMHVPASSREHGLQLLGVRRCLYAEGQMPHVMYEANGKPLSLFKLDGAQRPTAELSSLGHRCRIWWRDGHTFVLVAAGDAGPELARIASYVEREAR